MEFNAMEKGILPQGLTISQQQPPPPPPNRLHWKHRPHEDEEQGKLFVGGLSWDTTQETLLRYFGRFGEVIDCVVMKNAESGRSRGFGFVTFSDPANIEAVLSSCPHTLDGRTIDPKACNPRSMQKPKKTSSFPKIFLGGLPSNITETDLINFFSRYGEVCEVIIMYDQEKKKSRGFGFLSFSDEGAVNRACAEHFVNIQNKQVEIKRAEPRVTAAIWNKDSIDQWGNATVQQGGPPSINLNSPMQPPPISNGHHHHTAVQQPVGVPPPSAVQGAPPYSTWGSHQQGPTSGSHPSMATTPQTTYSQYGSTQIVPWVPPPPTAPTPPHHHHTAPPPPHPPAFTSPPPPPQQQSQQQQPHHHHHQQQQPHHHQQQPHPHHHHQQQQAHHHQQQAHHHQQQAHHHHHQQQQQQQQTQYPVYPPPSATPQPNYWNTQPTPPPPAAPPQPYSAYGNYTQYHSGVHPSAPPPHHHTPPVNKPPFSVTAPDFYHQNSSAINHPPLATSPQGGYHPTTSDLASGLGPQRSVMCSTQPSQYHPYRRS